MSTATSQPAAMPGFEQMRAWSAHTLTKSFRRRVEVVNAGEPAAGVAALPKFAAHYARQPVRRARTVRPGQEPGAANICDRAQSRLLRQAE